MAIIAQHEREQISARTKAALQAAKRRGQRLGNPNGAAHLRGLGNDAAVKAVKQQAQARAADLVRYVEEIRAGGITSDRGVALRSAEHTSELQSLMRISYAV